MIGHIQVLEHLCAAVLMILAFKLHLLQLFFNLFFHRDKLWVFTLHGAHTSLVMKFLETFMMEPILTTFALDRVNKNCLAKCAQKLRLQLILRQQVR